MNAETVQSIDRALLTVRARYPKATQAGDLDAAALAYRRLDELLEQRADMRAAEDLMSDDTKTWVRFGLAILGGAILLGSTLGAVAGGAWVFLEHVTASEVEAE